MPGFFKKATESEWNLIREKLIEQHQAKLLKPLDDRLFNRAPEAEWAFAKEKLALSEDGTKLRRKDHTNSLAHSFMVKDGQILSISEKGSILGEGAYATTKLAQNERGDLIALKIIKKYIYISEYEQESQIAADLGIAGKATTRESKSLLHPIKHYIAYEYLGTNLMQYFLRNTLSLDDTYVLCIEMALELDAIHSGKKSKSGTRYIHGDIGLRNIVIDRNKKLHFIDWGGSTVETTHFKHDIMWLLLQFIHNPQDLTLSILISRKDLALLISKGDQNPVKDSKPYYEETTSEIPHESSDDLYNVMADINTSGNFSALKIAWILTLFRLNLEAFYEDFFTQLESYKLSLTIQMLNTSGIKILEVYNKISELARASFENYIRSCLNYLINTPAANCYGQSALIGEASDNLMGDSDANWLKMDDDLSAIFDTMRRVKIEAENLVDPEEEASFQVRI